MMTFNVLHIDDNPSNKWDERKPLIKNLISRESPDIIGTQECVYTQVQDFVEMLPEYEWLGLGRLGGSKDDFMTIYYKRDRFTLIEYDHFWLSDTPKNIGSMTFGNVTPRMVTWGLFYDKVSKKQFYHMNTHLDYICEEAREKGAELIASIAQDLKQDIPIFLTGDFNTDIHTQPYNILTKKGPFTDSADLAKDFINHHLGTKNDFIDPTGGKSRIDWILTRGEVSINWIKIVDDCIDGKFPSDHFPVIASVNLL